MRITFVALGWEQLSISLLSAIAKTQGHDVHLAFSVSLFNDRSHLNIPSLAPFFDDTQDVIQAIKHQRPDVLAFSVLTANYQWMLKVAQAAKALNPRIQVIFGGVHPSAVPENVLSKPHVDYVVVGEGEVAFPLILDAIERGGPSGPIPNTRYKNSRGEIIQGPQTGFIQDLDSLPVFDKTIWEDYMQFRETYITMASRGCPYRCTFCFNNFFANLPEGPKGKYVRLRSPEHVMHELRITKRRYRPQMIEFFDDVFTVDKKWLKTFLDLYKKEIKVPFQCFTHVNFLDEETVRMMAEAGSFSFQIGIQSMDDHFKRTELKRYERTDQIEKTLSWMRKYNVKAKFDHMLGLPGEAMEAQETARQFYIEHPPYNIQTYWTKLQPGTEIVRQALQLGLISPEEISRINEGTTDCDIYSNSNGHVDPVKTRLYKAYEITFKLIPHLPKFMRRRFNPRFLRHLPKPAVTFLCYFIDIFVGLLKFSPDHILYAKYYFFHMGRFGIKKLGFKAPSATIPLDKSSFSWSVPFSVSRKEVLTIHRP